GRPAPYSWFAPRAALVRPLPSSAPRFAAVLLVSRHLGRIRKAALVSPEAAAARFAQRFRFASRAALVRPLPSAAPRFAAVLLSPEAAAARFAHGVRMPPGRRDRRGPGRRSGH